MQPRKLQAVKQAQPGQSDTWNNNWVWNSASCLEVVGVLVLEEVKVGVLVLEEVKVAVEVF
jgi:hypothetical protein